MNKTPLTLAPLVDRRSAGDGRGRRHRPLRLHADPAAMVEALHLTKSQAGPDRLGQLHGLSRGRAAGGDQAAGHASHLADGRAGGQRALPGRHGPHHRHGGVPGAARDRRPRQRLRPRLLLGAGAQPAGRQRAWPDCRPCTSPASAPASPRPPRWSRFIAGWREMWFASAGLALVGQHRGHAAGAARSPRHRRDLGPKARLSTGFWFLLAAYGLFGFGYIITATFIVQMVRGTKEIAGLEPYDLHPVWPQRRAVGRVLDVARAPVDDPAHLRDRRRRRGRRRGGQRALPHRRPP